MQLLTCHVIYLRLQNISSQMYLNLEGVGVKGCLYQALVLSNFPI